MEDLHNGVLLQSPCSHPQLLPWLHILKQRLIYLVSIIRPLLPSRSRSEQTLFQWKHSMTHDNLRHARRYTDTQWPLLNGPISPTLVGVAPPQYSPDRLNIGRYNVAVPSVSLLLNHDIPHAALPAPIFDQEWRNPLQSVGQDPLDPTSAVLNANPCMSSDDIKLTQVSCVPGLVDNSLTWARPIDPSPHLDYSIDDVSLLLVFCSYTLVMESMSFPSSNLH